MTTITCHDVGSQNKKRRQLTQKTLLTVHIQNHANRRFKLVLPSCDYFMSKSNCSKYIPLVSLSNILLACICVRRIYFSYCSFNSAICMCP